MITSIAIGTGGLGRFGNQMFTIAGVIGIAEKSGQPFGFPKWMNCDNALFGQPVDDMSEHFVNPLPSINGQQFQEYGYFWGYRDVFLPAGDWSVNAHLQSGKYFEHCMDVIRETFRMKDEPEQNDYVAIHYRAGDYIDNPEAYHPRCSKEYYQTAASHFPDNTEFVVFSDDNDAAEKVLIDGMGLKKNCVVKFFDRNKSYLEAFAFMKRCKSFIIANSSFSAMAAHLGEHPDKKVIAPKLWFGSQAEGMETKDIYSDKWIVI